MIFIIILLIVFAAIAIIEHKRDKEHLKQIIERWEKTNFSSKEFNKALYGGLRESRKQNNNQK